MRYKISQLVGSFIFLALFLGMATSSYATYLEVREISPYSFGNDWIIYEDGVTLAETDFWNDLGTYYDGNGNVIALTDIDGMINISPWAEIYVSEGEGQNVQIEAAGLMYKPWSGKYSDIDYGTESLNHELGHLKIAEIGARLMKQYVQSDAELQLLVSQQPSNDRMVAIENRLGEMGEDVEAVCNSWDDMLDSSSFGFEYGSGIIDSGEEGGKGPAFGVEAGLDDVISHEDALQNIDNELNRLSAYASHDSVTLTPDYVGADQNFDDFLDTINSQQKYEENDNNTLFNDDGDVPYDTELGHQLDQDVINRVEGLSIDPGEAGGDIINDAMGDINNLAGGQFGFAHGNTLLNDLQTGDGSSTDGGGSGGGDGDGEGDDSGDGSGGGSGGNDDDGDSDGKGVEDGSNPSQPAFTFTIKSGPNAGMTGTVYISLPSGPYDAGKIQNNLDDSLVQELNGTSYENFQNQGIQQEGY